VSRACVRACVRAFTRRTELSKISNPTNLVGELPKRRRRRRRRRAPFGLVCGPSGIYFFFTCDGYVYAIGTRRSVCRGIASGKCARGIPMYRTLEIVDESHARLSRSVITSINTSQASSFCVSSFFSEKLKFHFTVIDRDLPLPFLFKPPRDLNAILRVIAERMSTVSEKEPGTACMPPTE